MLAGLRIAVGCGGGQSPEGQSPSIPTTAVRSTSPDGTALEAAVVDSTGAIIDDGGGWLIDASVLAPSPQIPDTQIYLITYAPFSAAPNCVCTTAGADNHACSMSKVDISSAFVNVHSLSGDFVRPFTVMCVGQVAAGQPNLVTSRNTDTMLLASARLGQADGTIQFSDGDWIADAGPKDAGGDLPVFIASDMFREAPICGCSHKVDGGQSGSFCKMEVPASSTQVVLASTATVGVNPSAYMLACLGASSTDEGPFVVSSHPDGVVLASATIDSATSVVVQQDGAWVGGVTGAGSLAPTVSFDSSIFQGPAPTCLCTALDTVDSGVTREACNVVNSPSATEVQVMMTTENAGASANLKFSVICIGP